MLPTQRLKKMFYQSSSAADDRPRRFQVATTIGIRTSGPFLARLLKVVKELFEPSTSGTSQTRLEIASGGEFGFHMVRCGSLVPHTPNHIGVLGCEHSRLTSFRARPLITYSFVGYLNLLCPSDVLSSSTSRMIHLRLATSTDH